MKSARCAARGRMPPPLIPLNPMLPRLPGSQKPGHLSSRPWESLPPDITDDLKDLQKQREKEAKEKEAAAFERARVARLKAVAEEQAAAPSMDLRHTHAAASTPEYQKQKADCKETEKDRADLAAKIGKSRSGPGKVEQHVLDEMIKKYKALDKEYNDCLKRGMLNGGGRLKRKKSSGKSIRKKSIRRKSNRRKSTRRKSTRRKSTRRKSKRSYRRMR